MSILKVYSFKRQFELNPSWTMGAVLFLVAYYGTGWWWLGGAYVPKWNLMESHTESPWLTFHHCSALRSFLKHFETFDEILRIFEIYLILMKFLGRNVICEMKINEGRREGGRGSPEERDYFYHFHLLAATQYQYLCQYQYQYQQ